MPNNDDLINAHLRRLQKLKERQALLGINTPPEVIIEIEDIEVELARLRVSTELIDKNQKVISILFLASDPRDQVRLRLGEEFREIQEKLKMSQLRDLFRMELPQLSLRPGDIMQALLDTRPQIVHFSGHGNKNGLCFEDNEGDSFIVTSAALGTLFEQFNEDVNCIVLSACYSEVQADALSQHIDYIIGMNSSISDTAAILFATGFYRGLGGGRSIEDAYKLGCVEMRLYGNQEYEPPILTKRKSVRS